jgi:hypothetical protein
VVSQQESAIVLQAAGVVSILEVNVWGLLFYAVRIEDEEGGIRGIPINHIVGLILLFITHANHML